MKKVTQFLVFSSLFISMLLANVSTSAQNIKPDADNAGLTLPSGFAALKVADNLGRTRHIVVNKQGAIYAKLERLDNGKGVLVLKDTDGDGRAETKTSFGNFTGTGIATIVTGLVDKGQHNSKSITLDNAGNIYVNVGAPSNSCQEKDRTKGSMGMMPCPILDSAGGIWQFKVDQLNQSYATGVRYATGLRNVVGLDWNNQLNQLFVTQHGRDMLNNLFPDLYDTTTSAELPSETMYAIRKGDNAGWPYIYYDHVKGKKMMAPEYGGDGVKTVDDKYINPAMAFPAHMAPNGLLFYTGNQFPARYKNGAFIAFHGSWNRSPLPQEGYYVVFVPYENGKPTGKWEVFADGFSGKSVVKNPRDAQHRPCGLAEGPDGSLYISDDVKGTIYRIMYQK